MNPLLTTGAALLLAAGAAAQTADPLQANALRYEVQPVVQIEYGRAVLVQRGSRGELLLPESETSVSGIAYLLVGAGARASVSWRGQSSLLLHGPTEIEWAPADEEHGASGPVWSVLRLGAIDMEVRRGSPELKLPGGWHARLDEGAYYVSGNGRDACDFEIRAGAPLELRPELRGGHVRPPVTVSMGMRARLSSRLIAVSRPDTTADAGTWNEVSWPWHKENDPAHQASQRESVGIEPDAPSVTLELQPVAPVLETPTPEPSWNTESAPRTLDTDPPADSPLDFRSYQEVEVTFESIEIEPIVEPAPEPPVQIAPVQIAPAQIAAVQVAPVQVAPVQVAPVQVAPVQVAPVQVAPVQVAPVQVAPVQVAPVQVAPVQVVERTEPVVEPPAPVVPVAQPKPEETPAPVVVTEPAPTPRSTARAGSFVVSQWQGVAYGDLQPVGDSAFERSNAVRATRLGASRWRIALSARADTPVWFFGKDQDVLLQPGSSVTIGTDGFVQSRQGLTRSEDAAVGRPKLSDLDE